MTGPCGCSRESFGSVVVLRRSGGTRAGYGNAEEILRVPSTEAGTLEDARYTRGEADRRDYRPLLLLT